MNKYKNNRNNRNNRKNIKNKTKLNNQLFKIKKQIQRDC